MSSVFSHAVAGAALGTLFRRPGPPVRYWLAGAVCAMVPDLDVIGLAFGVPWGHMLGHRGLTHSLAFAAGLAALVTWTVFGGEGRAGSVWLLLFLATASHGVIDAMTDGGSGVAFFAPFSAERYFLPWRPLPVPPLAFRFFSARGWHVFQAELLLIWLPSALLALAASAWRTRGRRA